MSNGKASPNSKSIPEIRRELNYLYRRRQAINNMIRASEEYAFVADLNALNSVEEDLSKPSLRVVYSRSLKELMA